MNFADALDRYKHIVTFGPDEISPTRQMLIDYVTELEAKAGLLDKLRTTVKDWQTNGLPGLGHDSLWTLIQMINGF